MSKDPDLMDIDSVLSSFNLFGDEFFKVENNNSVSIRRGLFLFLSDSVVNSFLY